MAGGDAKPFVLSRRYVEIYGGPDEQRRIRQICELWPNLRPYEVARMPWHEMWFYVDWILDNQAEAAEQQRFDPHAPWSGGHLTAEAAAGLGVQVREI